MTGRKSHEDQAMRSQKISEKATRTSPRAAIMVTACLTQQRFPAFAAEI
jgi:hypothetical protein